MKQTKKRTTEYTYPSAIKLPVNENPKIMCYSHLSHSLALIDIPNDDAKYDNISSTGVYKFIQKT